MTTTTEHFRGLPPTNPTSQVNIDVENKDNKECFVTNSADAVHEFSLMENYDEPKRDFMIHENEVSMNGNNLCEEKVQNVNNSKEVQRLEGGKIYIESDCGNSGDLKNQDSDTEIRETVRNMREKRISATHRAATCLEKTLGDIKEATKKMLNEIDIYMKVTQEVELDYIRCQKSQRNEARRLQEVEPDVAGVTSRFYHQE